MKMDTSHETAEAHADYRLPHTMKEIEIAEAGGPDVLRVKSVGLPSVAADEVLIRVEAAGVNRPDVAQRLGLYPVPPGANTTPGLEVAGQIVAIGSDVPAFAVGDKVCALANGGGYAEFCAVPYGQVLPVPNGVTAVQAAAIPEAFFTVWANLFDIGCAMKGDRVLIHGGTSGIGTTALMICKEFGIKAFATVGSEAKADVVRGLGGEPINYRTEDFAQVVLTRTSGRGVNVVLDIMGASYFDRNVRVLARGGCLVIIGSQGGATLQQANLLPLISKRATLTGSLMRSRSSVEKADIARDLRSQLWPVLSDGRCLPVIDRVFPLANAAEAHRRMESGEHIGKIVLQVA